MPVSFIKKINAFVTTLDAAERRPRAARVCGLAVLLLLAASFIPDVLLVMDFSRPYQIAQYSQDEFWFMKAILQLQDAIVAGDFSAIHNFGNPFAYGFAFWLFSAVIALPFRGHVMLTALFLRFVYMAMKYAAFYVIYSRILSLTQKPLVSLLSLVLLLSVPAYVFDGKIISPEYMIMLLVALGWSALFEPGRRAQIGAAFAFALSAAIKINAAPLALLFLPLFFAQPAKQRLQFVKWWIVGIVPAVILFFFPAHPLAEILEIGAKHHVSYGVQFLPFWYGYNALEFDDMLVGGWSIEFLNWFLFFVLCGFAFYRASDRQDRPKNWPPVYIPLLAGTFAVCVLTCFLTSLTSLLHQWFVFAPFLLMLAAGCLLIGGWREGTAVMLVFVALYALCFGDRFATRWEHRVDKFDYVAATELADADVASWIAVNCPKAREAVIDYNLIWPPSYNGHLHRMWTLIEVEDYRRANGSAVNLLNNIDVLLLKAYRANVLMRNNADPVSAGVLGNFFPQNDAVFYHRQDFPQLSIYARKGVCGKDGS